MIVSALRELVHSPICLDVAKLVSLGSCVYFFLVDRVELIVWIEVLADWPEIFIGWHPRILPTFNE